MDDFYEYEREFYEEPDYEQFERRMLDLDRDAGEFDPDPYEPDGLFTYEDDLYEIDE